MAGPTALKGFQQGDRVVVSWRHCTYEGTIQSICPQFINIHNMVDLTDGKREKMDCPTEKISTSEIRKIFKANEEECRWHFKNLSLKSLSEETLPENEESLEPTPTFGDIANVRLIAAPGDSLRDAIRDLYGELVVGVDFCTTDSDTLLISVASPHIVYIFDIRSFDSKIPVELAEWFEEWDCIKALLLRSGIHEEAPIRMKAVFDILVAYKKVTGKKEKFQIGDIAMELLGVPPTYFQSTKIPSERRLSKDTLQSLARRAVYALKLYAHLEALLLRDTYVQHEKFAHILSREDEKSEEPYQSGDLYERFTAGQLC